MLYYIAHATPLGPCQFPTLGFVVSRYEQVQSFVPEAFWYIYLSLAHDAREAGQQTEFTWERGRLFEFPVAVALYEWVMDEPTARVTKVTKKNVKKWSVTSYSIGSIDLEG